MTTKQESSGRGTLPDPNKTGVGFKNNNGLQLQDVLKAGYDPSKRENVTKHGYNYDSMLSNSNQQVYYNPKESKLLFNVSGTHNLADVGTDVYLALGKLKDTNRYKEAKNRLKQAKTKYNSNNTVITGHSLGGAVSQYIASKDDKVYTFNKGATINQKTRKNETAYRTEFDPVSLLVSNSKRVKTLPNLENSTGFIGNDLLKAHSTNTLKNQKNKIFI